MKKSLIIAARELRERLGSRSFVMMALLGPVMVLFIVYLLLIAGGKEQQKWNIVVSDPLELMENRMLFREDPNLTYSFIAKVVEIDEFARDPRFAKFDAFVEINEKVLSNRSAFIFYREKPSMNTKIALRYHIERRLEEIVAGQQTSLTVAQFRAIKQPLTIGFRDAYDPTNADGDLAAWVGMSFGAVIFLFIFLFGMTILRSVSREKSNRIVEILVSTVPARSLMFGKVLGIGLAAFVQFILWVAVIAVGMYFMRQSIFPDIYDAANVSSGSEVVYNELVELVYTRISFAGMLTWFLVLFIGGYLFYGAFFAALGAVSGSESDGQQFLLPLIALLLFSLYSGYYYMQHPGSTLSNLLHYLPFTAPVVVLVKLAMGYGPGEGYQIFVSVIILFASAVGMSVIAGKLYRNGLLQYGHTLRFRQLVTWLKNK
jgi:ABC-2 type transport system permease protein